jgi:single-strand DNA-binding protein
MSKGFNSVTIVGNVGKDPETYGTGTKVVKFSVATGRYKGEETDWHRIVCFGKTADVVEQYVRKGSKILVSGRIQYSQTESNGETKYFTDIIANEIQLLDRRETADSPKPSKPAGPLHEPNDDLPF